MRSPAIGSKPTMASSPTLRLVPGITKAPSISWARASSRCNDCSVCWVCRGTLCELARCMTSADWDCLNKPDMGCRRPLPSGRFDVRCSLAVALLGRLPGEEATGLACPQCRVEAAALQQLGVTASLNDPALIHHHQAIHSGDGGEPVRDGDHGL